MKKKAVALRYDRTKEVVPKVVAKGEGYKAQKIIDLAKEHGVEIVEDPDLVQILSKVEIEEQIPDSLYLAVAKILAFVYEKKKNFTKEK